jgi:hypothetical protein
MGDAAAEANSLLSSLPGRRLSQLCVGVGELQLRFDHGQGVQLEGPITVAGGDTWPPQSLQGLALTLPLLNQEVDAAVVTEGGALSLTFGATTIRCEALESYEAWNWSGERGELVVCTPGGSLSIFPPRGDSSGEQQGA